jgi:drug/metabolite transporter (DMT)-like permease
LRRRLARVIRIDPSKDDPLQKPSAGLYLPYLGVLAVVFSNIAGNLMLKIGSDKEKAVLFGILSWQTLLGIGFFGLSVLLYAWSLRYIPLHIAQIIASLQYAGVIIAAALVLGEHIPTTRWLGIALVFLGIAISVRE